MYYFALVKATHNKGYLLKGKASSVDEFKSMISREHPDYTVVYIGTWEPGIVEKAQFMIDKLQTADNIEYNKYGVYSSTEGHMLMSSQMLQNQNSMSNIEKDAFSEMKEFL